jgi:putative endopeptidase
MNRRPLQNALFIPAQELQAPYFDPNGDAALNYAAFGARVGHFVALAFDDKGSRFDAQGSVRQWWSEADLAQFRQVSAQLATQYSGYKPFPDLALDCQRTLRQNIADLAGLQAARDAFHQHVHDDSKAADRRFFVAYAQSMRVKDSEQALRGLAAGSPVPPAPYRTATVRNLDGWYASFDVKPGQALYLAPETRVKIW